MRFLVLVFLLVGFSGPVSPQDWPSKTVRLVIPFPPGGSTDFQGRLLCDWLSRHFGQQFVIDHKPGAGSNIGVAEVARSNPDGYTLGWITVASHAINPTLYAKMPFDHIKDFVPGFEAMSWHGLAFPAATPPAIVEKLSQAVQRALATDELKEKYAGGGSKAASMTPRQFAAFIKAETERWAPVIKASGARVE